MQIQFAYEFRVTGVPKRARNEREVAFKGSQPMTVSIAEATLADCPVAFIVEPKNEWDNWGRTIRTHGGRIWVTEGKQATEAEIASHLPHGLYKYGPERPTFDADGWRSVSENTEAQVCADIEDVAKGILIVDDIFYYVAGEPRYVVGRTDFRTIGIRETHCYGTEPLRYYFRADRLADAQSFGKAMAAAETAENPDINPMKFDPVPDRTIKVLVPEAVKLDPQAEWKAMFSPSATRIAELQRQHGFYGDYNQRERQDSRYLAEHGHPDATRYEPLREFFDSLRYGANSSARYYTYVNEQESSEYWAPELKVRWTSIYPAMGEKYDKWLADVCANGFIDPRSLDSDKPDRIEPQFNPGSWVISAISEGPLDTDLRAMGYRRGYGKGYQIFLKDEAEFYRIRDVIDRHHQPHGAIATRIPANDYEDNAPLPMSEKKFTLANVDRVTIMPRSVSVPLIPLGAGHEDFLLAVYRDLVSCVAQGFGQRAEVERYLSKFVKAGALKKALDEAESQAKAVA